jgi:hypothetical protein
MTQVTRDDGKQVPFLVKDQSAAGVMVTQQRRLGVKMAGAMDRATGEPVGLQVRRRHRQHLCGVGYRREGARDNAGLLSN